MSSAAKDIVVSNKLGLHARPAMQFVDVANQFTSSVMVRKGGEEPADVLNGSEPFFPLESHRGETLLIAKDQVLEAIADIPLAIDEVRRATARSADVEMTLEDGSQRRGTVFIELPHERPRVLDFLNSAADRFVTLYAGGTATLINGQAIACVHPLD